MLATRFLLSQYGQNYPNSFIIGEFVSARHFAGDLLHVLVCTVRKYISDNIANITQLANR